MHSSPKIFPLRKAHNPLDPSSFHRIIFISAEGEETTRRPVAKPQFRRDATPREKGAGREKKSKRDTAYASLHGRGRDRVENFSKTFSRKAVLAFLGMTREISLSFRIEWKVFVELTVNQPVNTLCTRHFFPH